MFARLSLAIGLSLAATGAYGGEIPDDWNWSGAYLGVNAGASSLRTAFRSDFGTLPPDSYSDEAASIGVHAGYGRMIGAFYVGAEVDLQALDGAENRDFREIGTGPGGSSFSGMLGMATGGFSGATVSSVFGGLGPATGAITGTQPTVLSVHRLEAFETQVRATGSLKARLGMPVGRFLPYVTAGVTAGSVKTRHLHVTADLIRSPGGQVARPIYGGFLDDSGTAFGYSLGAGSEIAITPRLSVRAEYTYTDLGKVNIGLAGLPGHADVSTRLHNARLGMSYRF